MMDIAGFLLYHPSRQEFTHCPSGSGFEAVVQQHSQNLLRYYERVGSQPKAVLLYFHGNAGSACDRLPLVSTFEHAHELVVVFAEYPGYSNDASKKNQQSLTQNALALAHHLKEKHDLPIILMGRSLGSAVATYVASQTTPKALALVSPLTSIAEVGRLHYPLPQWIGNKILKHNVYPANQWASQVRCPVLLVHGDQDTIIPLSIGQAQEKQFTKAKTRFKVIPGAGHNDISMFPPYLEHTNRFLGEQL